MNNASVILGEKEHILSVLFIRRNEKNHWVKISIFIHSERRHARGEPGGESFISSTFIYFLGNTSNGGMKCPDGQINFKIVTGNPRSED